MATGRSQNEKKVLNETVHTCNRSQQEGQAGAQQQTRQQRQNPEVENGQTLPGRHSSQSEVRENGDAQRRKYKRQSSTKTLDYGDQKLSIDKENKSLENTLNQTDRLMDSRCPKSTGHQSNKMQTMESNNKQPVSKQSPYGSLTRQSLREQEGKTEAPDHARLNLGARQKQPTQVSSNSGTTSSSIPKYRPRSNSPNPKQAKSQALKPSTSEKTSKVQQSRSLDERRSRISRQRNSSFSNLQEDPLTNGGHSVPNSRMEHQTTQTNYSRCNPHPPTITLRRPSQTCLPIEHGLKCSDPLYQASLCLEVALPPSDSPMYVAVTPPSSPLTRPVSSTNMGPGGHPQQGAGGTGLLLQGAASAGLFSPPDQSSQQEVQEQEAARTCFCGYFIEKPAVDAASTGAVRKVRRCKFCRSKAKYLPGQRSLDAVSAKIFRRKKTQEPSRRAASEDRYCEEDLSQDQSTVFQPQEQLSTTPNPPACHPTTNYPSLRRPYPFQRQERMETEDSFSSYPHEMRIQPPPKPPSTLEIPAYFEEFPSDIRDYHHIPGPAPDIPSQSQLRFPHGLTVNLPLRDLPLPRQRSSATPSTSPGEFLGVSSRSLRMGDIGRVHSAPPAVRRQEVYPTSPPPAYDEVLKQPRPPPPTYDEAQMFQRSPNCQERSVSEDRAISGNRRSFTHSPHSLPGSRSSSTPRHGRRQGALSRAPAQDIPDIYWEQAARELDFCTCRKCQARYRQYFENEDPISPTSNDSMGETIIPMETQVLMQEIFTDGMAFCSLM